MANELSETLLASIKLANESYAAGFREGVIAGKREAYAEMAKIIRETEPQRPAGETVARPCTCHPDDNPPRPCPQKYALDECRRAAEIPSP